MIEQLSTLAVVGGYPGTLLFGYFISSNAIFYWPGAPYLCAAFYASMAAWIFNSQIYPQVGIATLLIHHVVCCYIFDVIYVVDRVMASICIPNPTVRAIVHD